MIVALVALAILHVCCLLLKIVANLVVDCRALMVIFDITVSTIIAYANGAQVGADDGVPDELGGAVEHANSSKVKLQCATVLFLYMKRHGTISQQ